MSCHEHQHYQQPDGGEGGVERNLQNKRNWLSQYYFQVTFALLMSSKGFRHHTYDISHMKKFEQLLLEGAYTYTLRFAFLILSTPFCFHVPAKREMCYYITESFELEQSLECHLVQHLCDEQFTFTETLLRTWEG